ncbi:DUF72 domain-containing protein [Gandjariella thermophila]|uniref:DUF72 domain-containing protein n=1 Tax=Gandjariella thermophila TaxID=1931992 RepID=A0A4D4J2J5_9PSEU|nr:DUF72 domain-containing protein [Gandjariella thermophila]GDY28736.1 hypothetical protein GTS_03690 [Gandjariella thermophila]
MGRILVGTASWTDRTLLASGWYPREVNTAEQRLAYYASRFPLVEVDSTYYSPPAEQAVLAWRDRTPAEFTFNIKAFSLLTQHPTRPASMYRDLRPAVEEAARGRKNVYLRDLDRAVVDAVWERFVAALRPLHEAGKLGAVLFQFPQWFPISAANKRYILDCRDRCAPIPICVEFRNHTWMRDGNESETLDFLTRHEVPYVCVDMPQGYPSSIPPTLAATGEPAVVRFHGHSEKWQSKNIYERFGYLYSGEEMAGWAEKLRELSGRAATTHALLNNCYRDYAQTNAQQLADLLAADHSVTGS